MVSFLIEFFQRLKSSSPAFFVKLRKVMIITGVIITGLRLIIGTKIVPLTPSATHTLQYVFMQTLIVIGTVTGFSFLPTQDPDLISDDEKQAVIKQALEQDADSSSHTEQNI